MTSSDLANLAQLFAAAATVLSLLFVGYQIWQNTRALKASAGFAATHSWAELLETALSLPSDRLAVVMAANAGKGWDDFPEPDRFFLAILHRALFQKLEGQYFLFKYRSLDAALWEKRRDWAAGLIKLPFYARWWEFDKVQGMWTDEFIAALEAARDASNVVPWHTALAPGAAPPPAQQPDGDAPPP